MVIRKARPGDVADIARLMYQLAIFEGYVDDFAVTDTVLAQRLFVDRDVEVLVAQQHTQIVGILVYYYLPFTYDLCPWIYIKELFVHAEFRSLQIGNQLMAALAAEGKRNGVSKLRWDVLATNEKASQFYQRLGATHEARWHLFGMDKVAMHKLADTNTHPVC